MTHSTVLSSIANIHSKQPWFVLSADQHFDLMGSNHHCISHFYSFKSANGRGQTFAVPDGCVDIVFDCDQDNPTARVCGTTIEARDAHLLEDRRYFGVRFELGVIPEFLGVTGQDIVDQEIPLLDLVPDAEAMFDSLIKEPEFLSRVSVFERFYRGQMARAASPLTQQVIQAICLNKGNIRMSDLELLSGYSIRTIQRQFRDDMGMTPKVFSRIIRCQSAIYGINHTDRINFADLACDLGFSDQPHFLREFKKLVSTTPLDYVNHIKQDTYLERIRYV
jgi:AraC-like DNA-binding protein